MDGHLVVRVPSGRLIPLSTYSARVLRSTHDSTHTCTLSVSLCAARVRRGRCTYPVVYIFPMLGLNGPTAVIGIQMGYCVADIISKCGVGFLIYNITMAKSAALNESGYNKL